MSNAKRDKLLPNSVPEVSEQRVKQYSSCIARCVCREKIKTHYIDGKKKAVIIVTKRNRSRFPCSPKTPSEKKETVENVKT